MPKFYRISEVARLLNVSPLTVSRWIREGRLKAIHPKGTRLYRIPEEGLKHFIGAEWLEELAKGEVVTEFYRLTEVANLLRVSPMTVRRWVEGGQLRAIHPEGTRFYRIPRPELERFIGREWLEGLRGEEEEKGEEVKEEKAPPRRRRRR